MSQETVLKIWLKDQEHQSHLPAFSSRGCTQTLSLIDTQSLKRTLDGSLESFGPAYKKYRSQITCHDKRAPAIESLVQGTSLWIASIVSLSMPLSREMSECFLSRDPVEDSVFIYHDNQCMRPQSNGRHIKWDQRFEKTAFLSYRPQLLMKLTNFHLEYKEWDLQIAWRLDLEEV